MSEFRTNAQRSPTWRAMAPSPQLAPSPTFTPLSLSYCPSSPPPMSPLPKMEGSSHADRPSYPMLKTYAAAVTGPKSGHASSSSDKENGSPGSKRAGMKLFLKPFYAKKDTTIPEHSSGESSNDAASLTPTKKRHGVTTPKSKSIAPLRSPFTPKHKIAFSDPVDKSLTPSNSATSSSSPGSGIRLKINLGRNGSPESITVLQSSQNDSGVHLSSNTEAAGHKRSSTEYQADEEDFTDSEIEIGPTVTRKKVASPKPKKSPRSNGASVKKTKLNHFKTDNDDDAVMSDSDPITPNPATTHYSPEHIDDGLTLMQPTMKRKTRIVDPSNAADAALIAAATKAGADIYDSDASDAEGTVSGTSKPHLFRNVKWGSSVTNYDVDFPRQPQFTQFVPGRWERQPDGSVVDQKSKLIVRLFDKKDNKRIFANPPPKDWSNQEAITALNKRTVQQIRRNTGVRFREVVTAYVPEERRWILANLKNGKPSKGWKRFVSEFNKKFAKKIVEGAAGPRPLRSHSSLTKEVERFGPKYYSKGQVPVTVADADKRKRKSH